VAVGVRLGVRVGVRVGVGHSARGFVDPLSNIMFPRYRVFCGTMYGPNRLS
jgi:hypothetical protein